MPIAAGLEALLTIYVMLSIGFLPPLVVFAVLLAAVAVLSFARPQPRVFLAGGILLLAFVATNFPFIIEGLLNPVGTSHAWNDIVGLVVGLAGGIAGIAAFVERRRGSPAMGAMRAPLGEALTILVIGMLVGTSYVSLRGFSEMQGSTGLGVANGVQQAPSQVPVELDVPGTFFTQKTLTLGAGPGTIYVVNTDSGAHTFDIDLNGRHLSYALPAHATTAVVLDLTAPGKYTYWCALPGHRASMEGTLEVTK
jgi:plastocyanin